MTLRSARAIVWALVIGHLLLALAYSVINPLGEAPDEADHWAYVVHIAREGELPGAKVTQAKHPPFYHATAALISLPADPTNDFLRINPDTELVPRAGWSPNFFVHTAREQWPWSGGVLGFHLARLWSVLLSTMTVAAIYGLARSALPRRTHVALGATALAAFLPEFAFVGSSVSNDGAAALFGTLGLWGGFAIYSGGGRFRPGWWTPLALGLGFVTKVSTAALWPVVGLAIVLGAGGSMRQVLTAWRRWLATGLLVFVPALLIAAPWLLRNVQLYGDLLGTEMVRKTVDLRTAPWSWDDTVWLLRGWFLSFWGKFGGAGHIPMPSWLYWLLGAVCLAAVGGLVRLYLRRCQRDRLVFDDSVVDLLARAFESCPDEEGRALGFLKECLGQLEGRARQLCDLRYAADLKPGVIAERLQMSANAVAKSLQRIREQLRECVDRKAAVEGGAV